MKDQTLPLDPFQLKRLSKWNFKRLFYTAQARFEEWRSTTAFERNHVPLLDSPGNLEIGPWAQADTAVSPAQAALLLHCLQITEPLGGKVVEIGSYRGVTTALLAANTARQVLAVDPFIGYGGAKTDMHLMSARIEPFANARHHRCTSGEAFRRMHGERVSFVFVDAMHDYVNARFDALAWGSVLVPGGVLAFHDTDSRTSAGVQRVVSELLGGKTRFRLLYHVPGTVAVQAHEP